MVYLSKTEKEILKSFKRFDISANQHLQQQTLNNEVLKMDSHNQDNFAESIKSLSSKGLIDNFNLSTKLTQKGYDETYNLFEKVHIVIRRHYKT